MTLVSRASDICIAGKVGSSKGFYSRFTYELQGADNLTATALHPNHILFERGTVTMTRLATLKAASSGRSGASWAKR